MRALVDLSVRDSFALVAFARVGCPVVFDYFLLLP
jgi:hypothetical protein